MKYFGYDNFARRYDRLQRAYFKTIPSENPGRCEAILAALKELKRLWQIQYLKGADK